MNNSLLSMGWVRLLTFVISIGLLQASCAQSTSKSSCSRIKAIVVDDLMRHGTLSCDSAVLFLAARDQNQAAAQAQNICMRLGAELTEKSNCSTTYELSDRTGKVTIIDFKNDHNIYLMIYLKVNCSGLTVKEVRFIDLKAYANLPTADNHRQ